MNHWSGTENPNFPSTQGKQVTTHNKFENTEQMTNPDIGHQSQAWYASINYWSVVYALEVFM